MKIYSENKKQNLNITLSIKICQQNDNEFFIFLKKLQEEMIKCIPLHYRIQTYVYPENTIHFSLMNFASFELDVDFEKAREIIESQEWYSDFKNYVNEQIIKILPETIFRFEKFYKLEDGSIKGSVSINMKNEDKKWENTLKNIQTKALEKLKKSKIPINNCEIKRRGGFFVINLLRFFGTDYGLVCESYDLEKLMEKTEKEFPTLKVTYPIVVISDSYLSNENPQIAPELS